MKILRAVVLLGTLAALSSASKIPIAITLLFQDPDVNEILLQYFKEYAFPDDGLFGGRIPLSVHYAELIPDEGLIIADMTAKHGGTSHDTFPCSAVIYVRPFRKGPPIPIAQSINDLFNFDHDRDLSCVTRRDPTKDLQG